MLGRFRPPLLEKVQRSTVVKEYDDDISSPPPKKRRINEDEAKEQNHAGPGLTKAKIETSLPARKPLHTVVNPAAISHATQQSGEGVEDYYNVLWWASLRLKILKL